MEEFVERRKFPAEAAFTKLVEEHIHDSDLYRLKTAATLATLEKSLQDLTIATSSVLEAYKTSQQALKLVIGFGKLIKYIGGLVLLYYSIVALLPPHNNH